MSEIKRIEICGTCFNRQINTQGECTCSYGMNIISVTEEVYNSIKLLKSKGFKLKINTNDFVRIID